MEGRKLSVLGAEQASKGHSVFPSVRSANRLQILAKGLLRVGEQSEHIMVLMRTLSILTSFSEVDRIVQCLLLQVRVALSRGILN